VPSADPTAAPPPGPLRIALATVAGNLYLVAGTLLFSAAAIVAALVPPRGRHAHAVARLWARGALAAAGVRLRLEHETPLDPAGRYVFLANHLSLFDIPALLAAIPGQVRFLAKAGLFRIPVFGWAMSLAGFVPVARGHRERARDSFAQALERLDRGMSILVFPEERRSLDGRLLPFKRGGMLLAAKSGLPIVPVGLDGTLQVQPMRSFLIRPRLVHVRFGRPQPPPESIRALRALTADMRSRIAELARTTAAADAETPSAPSAPTLVESGGPPS
jgi:1-acyl-sn-glycerol-3-phosphate acyltransferase